MPGRATPIDRAFQLGYWLAYRVLRVYWRALRPTTQGALVAVWHAGEVLLLRMSYVAFYSAPGGYLRRNEPPAAGAVRELREEVGIEAQPQQLTLVLELTHDWEGKRDHVRIYQIELTQRPRVRIDRREIVWADWYSPERAVALDLFPPLKRVIEARLACAP